MSYFDKFESLVKRLKTENPEWGSINIAKEVSRSHPSVKFKSLAMHIRRKKWLKTISDITSDVSKSQTEKDFRKDSATFEYKGEKSIQSLEEAIDFFEVDVEEWEVERWVCNSWDVTMKIDNEPVKKTNYQVKVWLQKIENLEVKKPTVFRPLTVEPSSDVGMAVVIGCVHRPFHHKRWWDGVMKMIEDHKDVVSTIILNGDYLDMRSLSSHEDWIPEGIDLGVEYSDGKQGIQDIQDVSPNSRKIFHYGNHEERFLRDKSAMRKYGSQLMSPEKAMGLEEYGWEVVTDYKHGYTLIGNDLEVFHGHRLGDNASKNHLSEISNRHCMFNHTHRVNSYSNKGYTAYNIGWGGDLKADGFNYADRGTKSKWRLGFGVVYIEPNGKTHPQSIECNDEGSFFFNGKIY